MMDGYAFAAADGSERFRVVGEVPAGSLPAFSLQQGECARIFTGAPLPPGADAVIPQEDTQREGEWMIPTRRSPKRWVRLRGSEGRPGDVIVRAGSALGGTELSALIQAGCLQPEVCRAVQVAHVATGDEVVEPMAELPPGKIRDTNSSLLGGLLRQMGADFRTRRCGDNLDELVTALPDRDGADLLLVSGGASVGDYDFGARALRAAGFELHFERLNLRPGKPLIFATRGTQAAFVIPGNPVSHFVCFQTVIRFAVERLQGRFPAWSFVEMPHGGEPLASDARETFWPAQVVIREGKLLALPKRWSSSGDTFSLVGVNGLIRVPCSGPDIPPGESVRVLLLDVPQGE